MFAFTYPKLNDFLKWMELNDYVVFLGKEWKRRITDESQDTSTISDVYKQTIGHEMGHGKKKPFKIRKKTFNENFSKNRTTIDDVFANWLDEVHADFYSSKYMLQGNRERTISSMEYKRENLIDAGNLNLDAKTHPSWNRRADYIKNYDFDEQLILQIADDVGETNQPYIKMVTEYYLGERDAFSGEYHPLIILVSK